MSKTGTAIKKSAAEIVEESPIICFKGFDLNLACRGFQYEIGKTYTHDGDIGLCWAGFHACEYPLDVFDYYSPAKSEFALVELSGESVGDGSKTCSQSIKIIARLDIAGLVSAAIEYTRSRCAPIDPKSPASATGDQSAAQASGYQSAVQASGDQSAAQASGDQSAVQVTGQASVAMACGAKGRALASKGSAIVLVNRNNDGSIRHIRASLTGENGVKPDTWYSLDESGEFVEEKL